MRRFVIIGGGIGGLATAASLRARGMEAYVYDRAGELMEVGAALALWPNATRVLKRVGALEELLKRAHLPAVGALRAQNGQILKKMVTLQTEVPTVFAHRADVHRSLLSTIPAERVHLNKTCTEVLRDGARIRAVFADGTMSAWADGLIGADGLRSVVRELTLKDGMPVYRGYVAWRGVAAFDAKEEMVGETWGRGQRFGFIPLGGGRVGWWATANKPGEAWKATSGAPPDAWRAELRERFKGWHDPIPAVLEATPADAMICNGIMDREGVPSVLGEGAVTLLGDAAHPTTPNLGQGACMAIEDGAVLSHALEAIPSVAAAFRVYEQTRAARTGMIVRESLKFGRIGQWESRVACRLRDALMRWAPDGGLKRQFEGLWMYDAWEAVLSAPVMKGAVHSAPAINQ